MSRILLGVSGGVAAYKALEFVRLATAAGHELRVIQTPASQRFVGDASFAALSGAPVLTSEFERDPARGAFPGQTPPQHDPPSHLQLVANAEIYLIAPASANTIAKLAHGLADNLLSGAALAATCPLVIAPAMNNRMYEHPATQANLRALTERGVHVIAPELGRLATKGEWGIGRLAEPAALLAGCEQLLARPSSSAVGDLQGLRLLITAGGTREPIDSVRFVGNSSSGRMGYALAQAALGRGAQVTLVSANVALPVPAGAKLRAVSSAAQLRDACQQEFADCEVLLMSAAVADFTPSAPAQEKIKKSGRERLSIELEPTVDVLSELAGERKADQTLVGFAAEHGGRAVEYGRSKLIAKDLDAVVVNDISRTDIGFDSDHNEVTIVTRGGSELVERAPKLTVAEKILDTVLCLRATKED
jgi:phosphopantothenoylcysteine decarboxylase/phosphopantothenate--cysteine ligase